MHGKWFPVLSALKPSFRKPLFLQAHLETSMYQLGRFFRGPSGCLFSCKQLSPRQSWLCMLRSWWGVDRFLVEGHLDPECYWASPFTSGLNALGLSDWQEKSETGGESSIWRNMGHTQGSGIRMLDSGKKGFSKGGQGPLTGEGILLVTWCVVH